MDVQPTLENAYAVVIGIASYQNVTPLPATVLKDAQDIYNLLVDSAHCGYSKSNIQLLLDKSATKQAIMSSLANLGQKVDKDSTVIFYISSHGGRIQAGEYVGEYLLPVDADYSSKSALAQTSISSQEFTDMLRSLAARKILVILDCCHAGGIGQPKENLGAIIKSGFSESTYDALRQGIGRVILASSRSDEASWVLPGATNSLFTQHLLTGLQGGIASEDGLIRIFDLFEYLQPRVTAGQPKQHPVFKADLENNFPVALYCGGKKGVVSKDQDGFRYDAYINYVDKEPDTTWVWDTLLPRLEATGLRVAVSGDSVDPGVPHVVSIERGIIQAKRTVAVLSDVYLADHKADFESIMAQTKGIQEGSYRLLPVKIAPLDEGKLPLRINMLITLDLSHPRRAEREFDRLVQALKGPLPTRQNQ